MMPKPKMPKGGHNHKKQKEPVDNSDVVHEQKIQKDPESGKPVMTMPVKGTKAEKQEHAEQKQRQSPQSGSMPQNNK